MKTVKNHMKAITRMVSVTAKVKWNETRKNQQ